MVFEVRIHSDVLTRENLAQALDTAELGEVFFDSLTLHRSNSRAQGYEVRLRAQPGRDRNGKTRTATNSGQHGAGSGKAATYDEWGYWIAVLFELDPDAVVGPYKGSDHFHRLTREAYRREVI
jgi:hypothetical protein